MLTAKFSSGKIISLVEHASRTELEQLRKHETFYCRGCSQKVILKLGTKRVFHFAHEKGTTCIEEYDRESEYHMQGKRKLFEWLKSQGLHPELEFYFPSIKQRADIAFTYEGKTYCLEYQCSVISEEQFKKRTESYQRASLTPFWIVGAKSLHRIGMNKASLTSFHYLFLRESQTHQIYLPSYCPQADVFILLQNIIPVSTRNAQCHFSITKLINLKFSELMNVQSTSTLHIEKWKADLLKFKKQLFTLSIRDPFLFELYSRSLNPYYIPPYVGLPLKMNVAIETPPFVWQTYIFLEFLYKQNKGQVIYFHKVYTAVLSWVKRKQIKIRKIPCVERNLLPFAVKDYLCALEREGILKNIKDNVFVIDKPIIIANNMDNWVVQQEEFYKRFFI